MKHLSHLLLSAACIGSTATVLAQPPGHPPRHRHPPSQLIRALDANKDGVISAEEIANAAASLKALDVNGDGIISADELRPVPPPDAPADAPPPPADTNRPHPIDPVMLALDANRDGQLSAGEIANAPTSLKALDTSKDGKLTVDELRPLPPEGASEDRRPPGN
jgi:Ca2+-binding EF-hand superfamily protein